MTQPADGTGDYLWAERHCRTHNASRAKPHWRKSLTRAQPQRGEPDQSRLDWSGLALKACHVEASHVELWAWQILNRADRLVSKGSLRGQPGAAGLFVRGEIARGEAREGCGPHPLGQRHLATAGDAGPP